MSKVFEDLDNVVLTEDQRDYCEYVYNKRKKAIKMFRDSFAIPEDEELTEDLIMQKQKWDPILFNNIKCASPTPDAMEYYIKALINEPETKEYAKYLQIKDIKR